MEHARPKWSTYAPNEARPHQMNHGSTKFHNCNQISQLTPNFTIDTKFYNGDQISQCNHYRYIPDICHFFYTSTFKGLKILHSKVRKFATKVASRQNSVKFCWVSNYTLCVKLQYVYKTAHFALNYTLCVHMKLHIACKNTHCVYIELHFMCKSTHCV